MDMKILLLGSYCAPGCKKPDPGFQSCSFLFPTHAPVCSNYNQIFDKIDDQERKQESKQEQL
jgi:hypothetical protein